MAELYIPFEHGQSEAADPKLLPQGLFTSAQNVRYRKDNRLGLRYGYAFISGSQGQMIAGADFAPNRSIYVKSRTNANSPALAYDRHPDGTYALSGPQTTAASVYAPYAPSLGVPRRVPAARNLKYTAMACDMAFANARICCAIHDFDYATGTSHGVIIAIYDAVSGALLASQLLGTTARNVKVLASGTTFCIVASNSIDQIVLSKFDAVTLVFGGSTVITTAAAGRGFTFDVSPIDSTNFLLTFESVASTTLAWGLVATATAIFTSKATQVIANPVRPSITQVSGGTNVALAWAEGATFNVGNTNVRVDTIAGAAVLAKTTVDNTGFVVGFPVIGPNNVAGGGYGIAWSRSDNMMAVYSPQVGVIARLGWLAPVSKPFIGPNNACLFWTANYANTGNTSGFASYKLIDLQSVDGNIATANCEAVACQHGALPGAYLTTSATNQTFVENRRFGVSVTSVLSFSDATAFACCLPIVDRQRFGADIVRFDSSIWADRLLPAKLNGQLFLSGARLHEFDGNSLYESGLADGPEYVTVTDAGAGTMSGSAGGTWSYVVIYEWKDAAGRRHQSPPSLPVSIVLTGLHNTTVTFSAPAFSNRIGPGNGLAAPSPGVTASVYRNSQSDLQTYRLVNATTNIVVEGTVYSSIDAGVTVTFTYTDSSTDSAISTNEILYTQGKRGGLSGILANDEPPPCRFIRAGNNRLLMAGLEEPSSYQFSKLVFPGEPLTFANNDSYKGRIDSEVSGIGFLDGAWFIGSQKAIYEVGGDGPDDTGGGGTFTDPVRLPSEVGFYSHRSIIEVPDGLMFQGTADSIYLLPRGAGAPVWISQPVRDTLASYPVITAAQMIPAESLVVFACMTAAGTDGRLLIFDMRIKEWYVDQLFIGAGTPTLGVFRCMNTFNNKLVLDGQFAETAAYIDDETGSASRFITPSLITGDIRPFGLTGHGRVRKATLIGEARDATTAFFPLLSVSYTSTNVFPDSTFWTIASLAAQVGDVIEAEHMLLQPKNDAFRFSLGLSSPAPTEGIVWNGLALEIFQESGLSRLPNAKRA